MPEHSQEATVTYCRHCEAELPLDANYCHGCGKPISADVAHRDHRARVIEFWPTYYITFMSIIQSLVLGYLLLSAKSVIATMSTQGVYNPVIIVQLIVAFVVIVSLWQGYMIDISAYRSIMQTPDAVIPFLFGITESFMIFSIEFQQFAWWCFNGTLHSLVVFLAVFTQQQQVKKFPEQNSVVLELLGPLARQKEIGVLFTAAIMFFFGVFEVTWKMNSVYQLVVSLVTLVMTTSFMFTVDISWKKFRGI